MKLTTRLMTWIIVLLAAACSTSDAETPTSDSHPAIRIEQVENGLVEFTASGPSDSGKKYSLSERMQQAGVPAVSVAVIDDYQVDWARAYGVRRAGTDGAVDSDTLFNAGSISKMFSAAGGLSLVEDGLLDLDQDVNQYLVSWQVPENEFTAVEKVTLRRLLSHSAGLQDGFTERSSADPLPDYLAPAGESPAVTIQEMLEAAPGVDVDRPTGVVSVPGAEYRYANADYAIFELLLEDVTGRPFSEFMSGTVLEPLELSSSTFEVPLPADLRDRAVWEHYLDGTPFENERLHFPFGTLWTTPRDLAEFAIEIMLAYKGLSERLLNPDTAQEMLSAQIGVEDSPLHDAYGFGFDLQTGGDKLVAFHTGGTWGSTALVWLLPETGQGAVVMTNGASGSLIRFEILYSIAEAYRWP